MTPKLLGKIKELVAAGAVVAGPRPVKSPSLSDYPGCDDEVDWLTRELWGTGEPPAEITERAYGKGPALLGGGLQKKPERPLEFASSIDAAKWIWYPEGNPAVAAPPGRRYFRRLVSVDARSPLESARIVMTADNSFTCWVNGHWAGTGDNFTQLIAMDVTAMLKPGANLVAVARHQWGRRPQSGRPDRLPLAEISRRPDGRNSHRWDTGRSPLTVKGKWNCDAAASQSWKPAMELGPLGILLPGERTLANPDRGPTLPRGGPDRPAAGQAGRAARLQLPHPHAAQSLRYIHRTIGHNEVYFVANKTPRAEDALGSFRVANRRPELWWPETGPHRVGRRYDRPPAVCGCRLHLDAERARCSWSSAVERRIEPDRIVSSSSRDGETVLATAPAGKTSLGPDDQSPITLRVPGPIGRVRGGSPTAGELPAQKRLPVRAGN